MLAEPVEVDRDLAARAVGGDTKRLFENQFHVQWRGTVGIAEALVRLRVTLIEERRQPADDGRRFGVDVAADRDRECSWAFGLWSFCLRRVCFGRLGLFVLGEERRREEEQEREDK